MPRVTVRNCTGSLAALELSQAPAGAPINSYRKRSYTVAEGTALSGTTSAPDPIVWGRLVSFKVNVTKPYTGTRSSLTLQATGNTLRFQRPDLTTFAWQPLINAKIAGERIIAPPEVTGAQSGDSGLTAVEPTSWAVGSGGGPKLSADISGEDPSVWPEFTIEYVMNQGVVSP
jgi:hypothetical protein